MESDEYAWSNNVRKNSRGIKVVIANRTNQRFVLLNAVLHSGDWACACPSVLEAESEIRFGALSNVWMSGVEGEAIYSSAGREKGFRVTWSNPYSFLSRSMVEMHAKEVEVSTNFKVDSHENGYFLHCLVEILPGSLRVPKPKGVPKRSESEEGIYSQMKSGYESLVNAFIRPPRAIYDLEKLGKSPVQFYTCAQESYNRFQ